MEIQYDKDGNGYEIGALYWFSDNGIQWIAKPLLGVSKDASHYPYFADGCGWALIKCCDRVGKIHKKPVELIEGEAYRFEINNRVYYGTYHIGWLRGHDNLGNVARISDTSACANIVRLVPEGK